MVEYRARLIDGRLAELVSQLPAISITGPRATGKTTTARRHAASVVHLDREAEAVAFEADPDVALRGMPEPVLLDEWQEVPGVRGAVKRAVDDDPRPGRFILTGSVRAELDTQMWPGTGRLVRLSMQSLTVRERNERVGGSLFLEHLLDADPATSGPADDTDLSGYLDLAVRSGFPEPSLRLNGVAHQAWLDSYVDQLITRDVPAIGGARDPERLRRYLEALAVNSAGVVEHKTLYEAVGIDRKTAVAYDQLLKNLLVLEALPAWESNRLSRLTRSAKRYLVEPAVITTMRDLTRPQYCATGTCLADSSTPSSPRRSEPSWRSRPPGRAGTTCAIRMDATRSTWSSSSAAGASWPSRSRRPPAPTRSDAKHLEWLRDELGERFIVGVVLHTGPRAFELADRIIAAPISTIWA